MKLHDIKFWSSPREWPFDAPEHMFLIRATRVLAKVMFGEQWTGAEPSIGWLDAPLPESPGAATLSCQFRAAELLAQQWPERPVAKPPKDHPEDRLFFTPAEWGFARDRDNKRLADLRAAKDRMAAVVLEIRKLCAFRKLRAYAQSPHSGEFAQIRDSIWNTDHFQEWFRQGKISAVDAFGGWNTNQRPEYWVFVSTADLTSVYAEMEKQRLARAVDVENDVSPPDRSMKSDVQIGKLVAECQILREAAEKEGRSAPSQTEVWRHLAKQFHVSRAKAREAWKLVWPEYADKPGPRK